MVRNNTGPIYLLGDPKTADGTMLAKFGLSSGSCEQLEDNHIPWFRPMLCVAHKLNK
jgi:hypothetical protein